MYKTAESPQLDPAYMHPSRTALIILAAAAFVPVLHAQYGVTEKLFVSAGRIEMQLGAGSYTIRPASDTHIRVTIGDNSPRARVALTANATRATGNECSFSFE